MPAVKDETTISHSIPKRKTNLTDMLSILIATYNYGCARLAGELRAQAEKLRLKEKGMFDYEIIISDDGTTNKDTLAENAAISSWPRCRHVRLATNGGLAHNRNELVRTARHEHVLLMDGDAAVCRENFIEKYWQSRQLAEVVCGSLLNPPGAPSIGHELRYRYERQAERRRTVTYRSKHPYQHFCSFNMLASKSVFERVRFDERCTEYGYEDALFGLELQQAGITVAHIDNPLIHEGIDSNRSFLRKTETAMHVLSRLGSPLQEQTGASCYYAILTHFKLGGAAAFLFRLTQNLLRRNLLGRHPSLLLFSLYKLGYYASLH